MAHHAKFRFPSRTISTVCEKLAISRFFPPEFPRHQDKWIFDSTDERERERGGNITTFPEWDNESVQVLCIGLVYRININNTGHLFTYSSGRNASCREKRIKMFRHEATENIGDSMLSSRSRYNFEYKCKHL